MHLRAGRTTDTMVAFVPCKLLLGMLFCSKADLCLFSSLYLALLGDLPACWTRPKTAYWVWSRALLELQNADAAHAVAKRCERTAGTSCRSPPHSAHHSGTSTSAYRFRFRCLFSKRAQFVNVFAWKQVCCFKFIVGFFSLFSVGTSLVNGVLTSESA